MRCFSFVASQLREPQSEDAKSVTPFVTISRQTGSGAHHIGNELVKVLNTRRQQIATNQNQHPSLHSQIWTLWDHDLVAKVLEFHHLDRKIAAYMPEDTVNEFNSVIEEMLGIHPSTTELVEDTAHTIRQLAHKGWCVIIGRASNIITYSIPHGVHIRLIGSIEKRSQRIAQVSNLKLHEAENIVNRSDRARRRYMDHYYGISIDDPTHYDLILNTDHVSTSTASHLIADLLCKQLLG
jgi:cytidylate kinase